MAMVVVAETDGRFDREGDDGRNIAPSDTIDAAVVTCDAVWG